MIDSFENEYAFLSNSYPSKILGEDGITYPTVEHYYEAHKAMNIGERRRIANQLTPVMAKKAGESIKLLSDWDSVKEGVMREGLDRKFADIKLRTMLLSTGHEELINGNYWHDNYWGNCTCPDCIDKKGKNKLGKMLMELREEYSKKR